ncbi:DUF736 family protein [Rhizobium sp. CNPSo 4039]|uniref:DUF736 family protein n=1 Tax=Rhizobium sp. CNPSo 4039 TaxID=3021409 RepID=UPI00254F245B|nr:DUF736 family protein [Rhizobium sp. CNPSo 4039]MDK4713506.1 DUF736 family protein [Rhizobium sp. CNPSo 4039]
MGREHRLDRLRSRHLRRGLRKHQRQSPVYRLFAKSPRGKHVEIGGIWKKQNQNGGDYFTLSVNTGYGRLNAHLGRYPG